MVLHDALHVSEPSSHTGNKCFQLFNIQQVKHCGYPHSSVYCCVCGKVGDFLLLQEQYHGLVDMVQYAGLSWLQARMQGNGTMSTAL